MDLVHNISKDLQLTHTILRKQLNGHFSDTILVKIITFQFQKIAYFLELTLYDSLMECLLSSAFSNPTDPLFFCGACFGIFTKAFPELGLFPDDAKMLIT